MSVVANRYATAPLTPTTTKYTNVDRSSMEARSWEGTYSSKRKFKITISNVNCFRAHI